MGTKAWIIFCVVCVVIIAVALVLMLVLVPQVKNTGIQTNAYESIAKQEYTFSGTKTADKLKQEYNVTANDVEKGKKTDKYEEGNINPFTPKSEVTIYNEPTMKNETNGSTELTPDSK